MNKNKNIIWLASYPKSGNTWLRVFLSRILYNVENINHLQIPIYSSKTFIEKEADLDVSELTLEELHLLRLEVFAEHAKNEVVFPVKIHDRFQHLLYGVPFLPFNQTKMVLYIIRNPFDVSISLSRHLGLSINETIDIMNNEKYTLAVSNNKYQIQMPQHIDSWSNHIKSWTEQAILPVYVVRYEDMIQNPYETFKNILNYCEITYSDKQMEDSLRFSSFSNLQKQEKNYGFEEKSVHSRRFFHTGKAYYYKNQLSSEQIKKIMKFHSDIIKKYNYEP